jgi:hypothetical protein
MVLRWPCTNPIQRIRGGRNAHNASAGKGSQTLIPHTGLECNQTDRAHGLEDWFLGAIHAPNSEQNYQRTVRHFRRAAFSRKITSEQVF